MFQLEFIIAMTMIERLTKSENPPMLKSPLPTGTIQGMSALADHPKIKRQTGMKIQPVMSGTKRSSGAQYPLKSNHFDSEAKNQTTNMRYATTEPTSSPRKAKPLCPKLKP